MQVLISTSDTKWIARYALPTTLDRTSTEYDYSTVVIVDVDTTPDTMCGKPIVRYDLLSAVKTLPRDHGNRYQVAPMSRVVTDEMRAMHAATGRMAV